MLHKKTRGDLTVAPQLRAQRRARLDREVRSKFVQMVATAKCRPGGRKRWMWDQAAHGAFNPAAHLLEARDLALEAGMPAADVRAVFVELLEDTEAAIAARDGVTLPPFLMAYLHEAVAETRANEAQAAAVANPTAENKRRAAELALAHEAALRDFRARCAIDARFPHLANASLAGEPPSPFTPQLA